MLKFQGHNSFRQRLLLSTLSRKPIRIDNIRSDDSFSATGLSDYEVSFLRLLEKATNGCSIEISHTGTTLVYRPGTITGGEISHECPSSRGIGYFLEPLIALAPFSKYPFKLTLTGITNNNVDVSVDTIRTCMLPQMKRFGIEEDLELKITKRGAPPNGGGQVYFTCPIVKELKPFTIVDEGHIKRIRGIAYATRVSPQMANRVVDSARSLLTRFIPDVYIYTDVYKGPESGNSPGYALTLVAESTTGVLYSAECAYQPRKNEESVRQSETHTLSSSPTESYLVNDYTFPTPEDLGVRVARLLQKEIRMGGCIDTTTQWLSVLFAALGPEDVSRMRVGSLTPFTVQYLRDIKQFLGVTFQVKPDTETSTVLMTCLGCGFSNFNKKAA